MFDTSKSGHPENGYKCSDPNPWVFRDFIKSPRFHFTIAWCMKLPRFRLLPWRAGFWVISIRLIVGGLLSNLWKVHVFTILKNGTNTIARVFYLVVRCSRARFQDVCWNQIPKDGGRPHLHGRPSSSWDPKFGATTNRRKETGSATKLRSNSSEHCTYERMAKSTCPLQNYV